MSGRTVHVSRPALLDEVHPSGSTVVEASAGTGKTYALEHIVAHAVLNGTPVDQILVITFTEKAAAELKHRVRRIFGRIRQAWDEGSAAPGEHPIPEEAEGPTWALTAASIRRVDEARLALARAPISTVHAFCHAVLREQAFACGAAFDRELVPESAVFDAAFAAVIRERIVDDPELARWLARWTENRSVDRLAELARGVWARGARPTPDLDADGLAAALRRAAELPARRLAQAVRRSTHPSTQRAIRSRIADLQRIGARFLETGDLAEAVDELGGPSDRWSYLVDRLDPSWPEAEAWLQIARDLVELVVPWEAAVLQVVLPHLEREVERVQAARGWMTFTDMVGDLDRALHGPDGDALVTTLRRRWRMALVDEFQDTDPAQWRILDRVFGESPEHRLVLVGDPKQAIYGFRGADVQTYLDATKAQRARGARRVRLARCFRSTPALVQALNRLLEPGPPEASFFSGPVHLEAPLIPGRPDSKGLTRDGDELAPVELLLWPEDEPVAPRRAARQRLARGIAEHLADLVGTAEVEGAPLRGGDVFVLTRTTREARTAVDALRRRGLAAHQLERNGWAQSREARDVLAVLSAFEDPTDPSRALGAFETPLFGVPPEALAGCRHLPPGHPWSERLFRGAQLADQRRWADLYALLVDDASVAERAIADPELRSRWPVFEAVLDATLFFAERSRASVTEVMRWLAERGDAAPVDAPEVAPIDAGPDAIRVCTMHGAKGLEADVVVVFGALFASERRLAPYRADDGWRVHVGPDAPEAAQRQHEEEEERLLYVAVTRARRQLILPAFPDVPGIDGPYARVDRALARWRGTPGFGERPLPRPGRGAHGSAGAAGPRTGSPENVAARPATRSGLEWRSGPERPLGPEPARLTAAIDRAGDELTSYTELKRRRGAGRPADDLQVDDRVPVDRGEPEPSGDLPGGPRIGKCLHALLETVDREKVAAGIDATALSEDATWLDRQLTRFALPRELGPPLAELVVRTLTRPLAFGDAPPRRLADCEPFGREIDFLFSVPRAVGGDVFVRGFIDALVGVDGELWVLDYKSDILPGYAPVQLEAHVDHHYALQAELYGYAARAWLQRTRPQLRLAGVAFHFSRAPLGTPGEGLCGFAVDALDLDGLVARLGRPGGLS
jgi:exodeoxyribonuclease V beta subunit